MVPSGSWKLTAYYTPVESFHHGPPQAITGCDFGADECGNGTTPLGSYPGDFLQAIKDEGAGRVTGGKYTGKFLTWDTASGWSVDAAAFDASEKPRRPFVSAAADDGVLPGTGFSVQGCGVGRQTGAPVDTGICSRIMAARWVVADHTDKPAGSAEFRLYVGEEDRPDFESTSPLMIDSVNARIVLQ